MESHVFAPYSHRFLGEFCGGPQSQDVGGVTDHAVLNECSTNIKKG